MRVYLCGPINGCDDAQATEWREVAKSHLAGHCTLLDPMRRDYRGREHEPGVADEIVTGDRNDIDNADALLVNAERPSWGTAREIEYARALGKRVFAFVGWTRPSPWLSVDCTLFPRVEDACVALRAYADRRADA